MTSLNATRSVTVDATEVMVGPMIGAEGHIAIHPAMTLYGQVGWAPALGGQGSTRGRVVESGERIVSTTSADGSNVTTNTSTVNSETPTETASGFFGQSARGLVGVQLRLLGLDTFVEGGARTYVFGTGPQTQWHMRGGAGLTF
ncbi:MAG: hypothetical protein VKO21_02430 [Candidatus Sericytochromatia bacterium]|nr:hypothetical protein [Candidatus Sericytochromatia bacterium]